MYSLIRYEKSKNWKGEDRVFCHIEVQTEDDVYTHAEWLKGTELQDALADKNQEAIVANVAKRAGLRRPQQLAEIEHQRAVELEDKRIEVAEKELAVEQLKTR